MTLGLMFYIIGSALIPSALAALIGTLEAPLGAFWGWIGAGEVPRFETVLGGMREGLHFRGALPGGPSKSAGA